MNKRTLFKNGKGAGKDFRNSYLNNLTDTKIMFAACSLSQSGRATNPNNEEIHSQQ